ncbi:MAG: threonine-phosphate decarboxylase, partial [Deltaproteobacteria bacterium]|nr:threonine-phosphate decarboxylase [Deltaproteobacteria bacterium]
RAAIDDFSASINPLGTPPEVQQTLLAALERIGDYPEIEAASLRRELAQFHDLPEEHLLPGSGSTELIYLLPRVLRPRRALLVLPCFSEYAPALQQAGCRIDTFYLSPDDDFAFSVPHVLAAVEDDTDLLLLANPGNPTGIGIEPRQLLTLAERLGRCRLLVDEAFVDFCPERSVLAQVAELPNLLVLRSLTKFYAIPGLRVGYLAAAKQDIALLSAAKEPWTLSNLAIAAAKTCLGAENYRQQTRQLIPQLRNQLQQGLELLGIKVYAGEANYLLCRLPEQALRMDRIVELLRADGLLIRNCDDFLPLDSRFFRVAVLARDSNRQLLEKLRPILD